MEHKPASIPPQAQERDTETSTMFALGSLLAFSQTAAPDSVPYVVLPPRYEVHELETTLAAPLRKRGVVHLRDAASFIRVVAEQGTPNTKLYGVITPAPSFQAIFDDHGDEPGWREHRASYDCPLSVEWKKWDDHDGRGMTQEAFAQFIEDNAPDCVAPPAAEMMEIARTLQAKKKVNFASSVRLQTGQTELTYEETIDGTAGKGKLPLPETFQLGIPVLEGGPRYAVEARLRFRIGERGALSMWYDIVRPHKIVEAAVRDVWKQIEEGTGLTILHGAA